MIKKSDKLNPIFKKKFTSCYLIEASSTITTSFLTTEKIMLKKLKPVLDIQELDIKMIRLMRIKKERLKELEQIEALRKELHTQLSEKEKEIEELNKTIHQHERKIEETAEKLKTLESRQGHVKKVEEFNALTQEMTATEREKIPIEQKVSDLVDRRVAEEEVLEKIKESLKTSESSSVALEKEIQSSIRLINEEGSQLKNERDQLIGQVDADLLHIYERLLRNKKDRVVVPIENRTCSGCHIVLTAQHENLVRKGENIVFCEHCSRIHYWLEPEVAEEGAATPKRRRRRMVGA